MKSIPKHRGSIVYCTYFDKGFLLKGLALHASLIKHNPNVELWILAFDKYTENILKKMKLKGVTVVSLPEFEDKELLAVKPSRHTIEYYWTSTPAWILYVMKLRPDVRHITYLDADLYFYSNSNDGVLGVGDRSLLVVEHRFPPGREGMEKISGRFNVAFNVFKNDEVGKTCLRRWRKQCLDWCSWKPEGGKLGDQMYLNEWPKLYGKNLVVSENVGVDAAPWNVSQYNITSKGSTIFVNKDRLVCYHFHQFQILGPNRFSRVLGYTLSKLVIKHIYEPYEKELELQYARVKKIDNSFVIVQTKQDVGMLLRHRLAKYFGPFYWRMKSLLK